VNNLLLQRAETWLSELGIKTFARPTCLLVSKESLKSLDISDEDILKELRIALNSTRLYLRTGELDNEWFYLDSF
jgi:hypothetical protein